jgi:hypothetical protein
MEHRFELLHDEHLLCRSIYGCESKSFVLSARFSIGVPLFSIEESVLRFVLYGKVGRGSCFAFKLLKSKKFKKRFFSSLFNIFKFTRKKCENEAALKTYSAVEKLVQRRETVPPQLSINKLQ